MNSLLYLVLFSACVFSAIAHIQTRPLRRPPPPFDLKPRSDITHAARKRQGRSSDWRRKTFDRHRFFEGSATTEVFPTTDQPQVTQTKSWDRKTNSEGKQIDTLRQFDTRWRIPWPRDTPTKSMTTSSGLDYTTAPPFVLYKRDCDPCMPGWGVKALCNDTSNTICQPCPMGQWAPHQPHFRPCMPCKKCKSGEFEETTCVSTRDTKCDLCTNARAHINDDFLKKCDWSQLAKNTKPQVFDMEVVDMQSKELGLDGSPEFGSNEDDLDRLLLSHPQNPDIEEDITVDDPEIDLDKPEEPKTEVDEDVSKEEENEWTRIMAMRGRARAEIARLSERLAKADDDGDDDDWSENPRRFILHPSRPFPQMVPAPRVKSDDKETDLIITEDDVEPAKQNNFPPSYHTYPIDSLLHSGDGQRKKAIVLLVLTCAIVLSTVIFVACYVREFIRRRGAKYNRVLVVNLSPEEREIVRQSASALEKMEQPPKKYRSGNAYATLDDEDPEVGIYVTENPLEAYLNATDERHVAKESLLQNEVVHDDPQVHRRTADA